MSGEVRDEARGDPGAFAVAEFVNPARAVLV